MICDENDPEHYILFDPKHVRFGLDKSAVLLFAADPMSPSDASSLFFLHLGFESHSHEFLFDDDDAYAEQIKCKVAKMAQLVLELEKLTAKPMNVVVALTAHLRRFDKSRYDNECEMHEEVAGDMGEVADFRDVQCHQGNHLAVCTFFQRWLAKRDLASLPNDLPVLLSLIKSLERELKMDLLPLMHGLVHRILQPMCSQTGTCTQSDNHHASDYPVATAADVATSILEALS